MSQTIIAPRLTGMRDAFDALYDALDDHSGELVIDYSQTLAATTGFCQQVFLRHLTNGEADNTVKIINANDHVRKIIEDYGMDNSYADKVTIA